MLVFVPTAGGHEAVHHREHVGHRVDAPRYDVRRHPVPLFLSRGGDDDGHGLLLLPGQRAEVGLEILRGLFEEGHDGGADGGSIERRGTSVGPVEKFHPRTQGLFGDQFVVHD